MVLCKFFQQGSCRFGSKCVNEHFDVKQLIKTDVEAAINGKQWPLSTYGPFKDKPSIPNFIEDQSFEEVRMLCYEAKQKNFFEQFHQQFNKEALEASNKMKALLQLTPEIIDYAVSVYDSDSTGVSAGKRGLANPTTSNAGSIFAKSNNNNSGSIFGNSNTFGGTSNQASTGLFGNSSVFNSQPQQQQQTSIFAQASKPANSIFGGSNSNTQTTPSIFGQQQTQTNIFTQQQQQQQQQPSGGIFSQAQQTNNIFRQVAQSQQGLFAQAAQQTMVPQQPQGLFAQAAQQTMVQTPNAGQGLFAQAAQQTQNIFGQAMQQQQQQPQTNTNIFQQNAINPVVQQAQTTNIFQQNPAIVAQQQQPQVQQPPVGLFQQAAMQTPNFAGQMNQMANVSSTLYSRLEDLTAEEIDAFKSDCFLPGNIPFNPPPRELIN